MQKKAIVYTSASLNGSMLLTSIDCALWLHKSDGYKKVTINCISGYGIFNFFNVLMRFKNLFEYLTKSKFKKLRDTIVISNNYSSVNFKKNKHSEMANFALGKLDQTYLTIGDLEIQFVRIKLNEKRLVLSSISLIYKVILDYFKYFRRSALKRKGYLEYKVANINCGLNILSEALRADSKSCGSIFKARLAILSTLYKLNCSFIAYKQITLPKGYAAFTFGPDQEYIYGFFSRFMSNLGAYFIDTSGSHSPYIKRKLEGRGYDRLKISPRGGKITQVEKEKVSDYYKRRISKPWEVFSYADYFEKTQPINLEGVSVIVYLHSFTDGQFLFGYDGYHDLMDWSISTISLLNSNKHVSRVIIKPHPGVDPTYHPGDAIANKYLDSQFSTLDKVQWADYHFDVDHINSSGIVVGISHHGSVAEELVFNKIPVIASTHSSWGNEYKFGFCWDDLEDYESLISTDAITRLVVTKKQIDELYRYAMDGYCSVDESYFFDVTSTWMDMLKIYGVEKHHEFGENMEQIKLLVSRLDPEDEKWYEYINTRLLRINLLKEVRENAGEKV